MHVQGELRERAPSLFREATADLGNGLPLIVDLSAMVRIDAGGVGVLLGLIHRCREQGSLVVLAGANADATAALRNAGAHRIAVMAESVVDGVAVVDPDQLSEDSTPIT